MNGHTTRVAPVPPPPPPLFQHPSLETEDDDDVSDMDFADFVGVYSRAAPLEEEEERSKTKVVHDFDAVAQVHVSVLARLAEVFRFTVDPLLLDAPVTRETLTHALQQHHQHIYINAHRKSQTSGLARMKYHWCVGWGAVRRFFTVGRCMAPDFGDGSTVTAIIAEEVSAIWQHISSAYEVNLQGISFRDLLNAEFPVLPELSEAQKVHLRTLGNEGGRQIVTKDDVAAALMLKGGASTQDVKEAHEYIFASGAEVLPIEVYQDVVESLQVSPLEVTYDTEFFQRMADRTKRMMTFWSTISMILLIPSMLNIHLVQNRGSEGVKNMRHWVDDEWPTGCDGRDVTSAEGCEFIVQQFSTIARPEQDAGRFLHNIVVNMLWTGDAANETAAEDLGGLILLGGLDVRQLLGAHNLEHDDNCSTGYFPQRHYALSVGYACEPEWHFDIPFHTTTKSDAADKLASIQLPNLNVTDDYDRAIMLTFGAAVPEEEGMFVYNKWLISFPAGGGVFPHLFITYFDKALFARFRPVLITNWVLTGLEILLYIFCAMHSMSIIDTYSVLRTINIVLMSIGYYQLSHSELSDFDGTTSGAVTTNALEAASERMALGLDFLGFWMLLQIATSIIYFGEKSSAQGIHLIADVLRSALFSFFALTLFFGVITVGIACLAMVMFGAVEFQYATLAQAMLNVCLFYIGSGDLDTLQASFPTSGPVFYILVQIVIVFFVLNMLVAVVTAPMGEFMAASPTLESVLEQTQARIKRKRQNVSCCGGGCSSAIPQDVKHQILWPLVNFLFSLYSPTLFHWVKVSYLRQRFNAHTSLNEVIDPGTCLDQILAARAFLNRVTPMKTLHIEKIRQSTTLSVDSRSAAGILQQQTESRGDNISLFSARPYNNTVINATSVPPNTSGTPQPGRDGVKKGRDFLWHRNPLFRTCVANGAIERLALATIICSVKVETPFDIVREARLIIALCHYDKFHREVERIAELQDGLRETISEKSKSLQAIMEKKTKKKEQKLNPDNYQTFEVKLSQRWMTLYTQLQNLGIAPSKRPSSDHLSVFYSFDSFIRRTIRTSWLFLIGAAWGLAVLTVVFYMGFTGPNEQTAVLARAVHIGLRDAPPRTRCSDTDCTETDTMNFTFNDVDGPDEFRGWLAEVFRPAIWGGYSADVNDRPNNISNATFFDPRIHRVGPIYVRQLRARALLDCPYYAKGDPLSNNKNGHFTCYDRLGLSTGDTDVTIEKTQIPPPSTGIPAGVDPGAYEYSAECKEDLDTSFIGLYSTYDCIGYTAVVDSEEGLVNLFNLEEEQTDGGWMSEATRLVVITTAFTYGESPLSANEGERTGITYQLIAEMGNRFVGGQAVALVFSEHTDAPLRNMETALIIYQVMLAIHLVASLAGLIFIFCAQRGEFQPTHPMWLINTILPFLPAAYTWIIYPILTAHRSDTALKGSLSICAFIYGMWLFMEYVLFPVLDIISDSFKTLINTMVVAVRRGLYVIIPFAILIITYIQSVYYFFGRLDPALNTPHTATALVSLFTFDGIDVAHILDLNPIVALIFVAIFFATVAVMLSNIILAMVTSATGEAQEVRPTMELCLRVLRYSGLSPLYGRYSHLLMRIAILRARIRRKRDVERVVHRPVLIGGHRRCLFPSEIIMAELPPLRISRVLRFMEYDSMAVIGRGALIPWLLGQLHSVNEINRNNQIRLQEEKMAQLEEMTYVETYRDTHAAGNATSASTKAASITPWDLPHPHITNGIARQSIPVINSDVIPPPRLFHSTQTLTTLTPRFGAGSGGENSDFFDIEAL